MDMVSSKVLSPAKINLMLRIIGQRPDGYHLLQTCFQLLDWGDELSFNQTQSAGSNQLKISGFDDLPQHDNLIDKAAMMLKPWAQNHSDWTVHVDKNIPQGAGLGGGSSNAAVALKFFNQAWQCDLSTFDLLAMAVKLGADVPIFVIGQSALAGGIGDQITPVSFVTPYIVLLMPDCHINTKSLFQADELVRDQTLVGIDSLQQASFWINDFMPVVLHQFPQVADVYQKLKAKMQIRLSGTGSTLFALFNDKSAAQTALLEAQQVCRAKLVRPLNKES